MKHVITAIVIVLLVFSFSTPSANTLHESRFFEGLSFVGLWQGIDPADGSNALRSLTLNENGIFNVIGYESSYIGCPDQGIVTGTGSLEQGELVADLTLQCLDNGTPVGPPLPFQATYVRDRRNGTLEEVLINFPSVIYHRISRR